MPQGDRIAFLRYKKNFEIKGNIVKKIVLFSFVIFIICFTRVNANENTKEEMTNNAKKWIAHELSIPYDKVHVKAPDKRVKVSRCKSDIKFDFPFNSKETVRARCQNPYWQFFLRVSSDDPDTVKVLRPKKTVKRKEVPKEYISILVANSNLMRGDKLTKKSVKLEKRLKRKLPVDVFTKIEGLENYEMANSVKAGEVIRSIDIKAEKLIKKGDKVLFSIMARGMLVKATVEALQDGRMGEQIKLINKDSGKTVIGVVTGKNKVTGL